MIGKVRISIILLLLTGLLASACAPSQAPSPPVATATPPPQAVAPLPKAPERAAWEEKWETLVNAAKKEGTLVLLIGAGGELRVAISRGFEQRFGIRVEAISGRGGEMSQKLQAERRAGIYSSDNYVSGTTTMVTDLKPAGIFDPLEPALVLPEAMDPKAWWKGRLDWVDADRTAVAFVAYPKATLGINNNLVKPEEIKSYRDLLNPKWKGKMVMNDPTVAGTGQKFPAVVGDQIMGWDYIRELAKQEPVIIRDQRLQVEWLAHGKYAIAVNPDDPPMTEFIKVGAPISRLTPQEGTYVASGYGNVALINRAPHPNAAKLFVNWLLSKEGQTIFCRTYGVQSGRVDIIVEGLDPLVVRDPKMKYFDSYTEAFVLKGPEQMKLAKEIFGHLMR